VRVAITRQVLHQQREPLGRFAVIRSSIQDVGADDRLDPGFLVGLENFTISRTGCSGRWTASAGSFSSHADR